LSQDVEDPIRKAIERENQELQNWRGRRMRACRAAQDLHNIIEALGVEDGSQLPAVRDPSVREQHFTPAPSAAQKAELQNMAANLLRMVLLWNDGQVSPSQLNRF
jgi:hypothetical protein